MKSKLWTSALSLGSNRRFLSVFILASLAPASCQLREVKQGARERVAPGTANSVSNTVPARSTKCSVSPVQGAYFPTRLSYYPLDVDTVLQQYDELASLRELRVDQSSLLRTYFGRWFSFSTPFTSEDNSLGLIVTKREFERRRDLLNRIDEQLDQHKLVYALEPLRDLLGRDLLGLAVKLHQLTGDVEPVLRASSLSPETRAVLQGFENGRSPQPGGDLQILAAVTLHLQSSHRDVSMKEAFEEYRKLEEDNYMTEYSSQSLDSISRTKAWLTDSPSSVRRLLSQDDENCSLTSRVVLEEAALRLNGGYSRTSQLQLKNIESSLQEVLSASLTSASERPLLQILRKIIDRKNKDDVQSTRVKSLNVEC